MRIQTSFEISGYFWLPAKPNLRLPGVLYVSEAGETTLEVIGLFENTPSAFIALPQGPFRVVGVVENGDLVTLDNCYTKSRTINFGGLTKFTVFAQFLLRGVKLDEDEVITISEFRFSLEGLDDWLSVPAFRIEWNQEDNSGSIDYSQPKEVVYNLPSGMTLAIIFCSTTPLRSTATEATFTQKAFVSLRSDSIRPLEEFLTLVFKVSNFLCFAMDETVSLDSATCFSCAKAQVDGDGARREVPIKLYYKCPPFSNARPKIAMDKMLFRYDQVANQLESILKNWLNNYETSEPAFNLYFASKVGAHVYLEGQFLSLAQGIETLHRRNSKETLMPESEFKELVASLVSSCPPTKQEWLKTRLEHVNELSLRCRVRQMLEPFETLYGEPTQLKHFIRTVCDTRNYLTHYNQELAKRAAKGEDLWELCMKLEALFQLHLLRLIGFDGDFIKRLARENRSIRCKLKL